LDQSFIDMQKQETLDNTIDKLRYRFGHYTIQRGICLVDTDLSHINPKDDHLINSVAYR